MLDVDLLARVERLIGAHVEAYIPATGGYSPALRLRCRTSWGGLFVKVGVTPLTAAFINREIEVYRLLQAPFMPRLVAAETHPSAPILAIEDLSTHRWPPPWDAESVDRVRAGIDALHAWPAPAELAPFAAVHGEWAGGWRQVAADPAPFLALGIGDEAWLAAALPALMAAEARCPSEGEALCHWDLRSDNICLGRGGAVFVDWNLACRSDPRLDLGFWLPSLAYEGGPDPEALLPNAPEVAAWVAGFFAARAGLPGIPDAPRVRRVQREQLSTALPWVVRALDLPPPAVRAGWI
jgi:hypothetical protein